MGADIKFKVVPNDSADTALAIRCLYREAITRSEFRDWAEFMISKIDEPPDYLFEFMDYHGEIIYKIIDFVPTGILSDSEALALTGIALRRGVTPYEPVSREDAEDALRKNPHIEERFMLNFPFVKYEPL